MIAKVRIDDKEYLSYIYFICEYEHKTKVIVFNDKENKFEFIQVYKNKYSSEKNVYIYDYKEEGMINKKLLKLKKIQVSKCLGYPWLINNINLINDIEEGNSVSEEYLKLARELNASIDIYCWHEITNTKEADELMDISGAFHDSYIRDIKGVFGRPFEPEFETKLQISFEIKGSPFDILLEFEGDICINYRLSSYLNDIYLSSIVINDNRIYWLDGDENLRIMDINDFPYISSQKLRWKIIDKIK